MKINRENKGNLKIEGHKGTWYVIDERLYTPRGAMYLLESEVYGDYAPCLIVNANGKILMDNVYNGFGDWDEEHDI